MGRGLFATIDYPKENDMTSDMTNKGTRWLAALVAIALLLALMIGGDQPSAQAIDPGDTDIAYVADGYNFPDALMGATLAALNAAPMLGVRSPTTGDTVPPETADELDRLTNDKTNKLATIYVFGGPAAVSDKVVGELEAWANNVQRIFGDDRFGTMEAISQALPTKVKDSDLLDGMDSSDFLGATEKAADSELLDGLDSTDLMSPAFFVQDTLVALPADATTTVLSQSLPAGNFLIFTRLGVNNNGAESDDEITCTLTAGTTDQAFRNHFLGANLAPGETEHGSMMIAHAFDAPGSAELTCTTAAGWSGNALDPSIVAVRVTSIN